MNILIVEDHRKSADFQVATANPRVWLPNPGITYGHVFMDIGADPDFQDTSDTDWFADGTHLTDDGQHKVYTDYIAPAYGILVT